MPSNTTAKQQDPAEDAGQYKVQYDRQIERSIGAMRETTLVSFHDMKTEGMPTRFVDDIMAEFFSRIEEQRYSGIGRGDDWFIYDTSETLDRQKGASEALHGVTVAIWVTIKPLLGAAGPERQYEGRITATDDSAYPIAEAKPLATAAFQVSIVDDEDAKALLNDVKEKTLACATALEEYEGDSRQLDFHGARMKEAALAMDRAERHANGPWY